VGCNCCEYPYHEPARGSGSAALDVHRRAKALGYKDTSDAMKRHVDTEDKLSRRITDSGQRRNVILINESGLYALILSSKLKEAKPVGRLW
jgi:prophage antirepressor-like protein